MTTWDGHSYVPQGAEAGITVRRCECTEGTGPHGCQATAQWLVGIGSRMTDRQLSCGRHLNRTCWLMLGAELPGRAVTLSVTPVVTWQSLLGEAP
jgi:hypothetical protein